MVTQENNYPAQFTILIATDVSVDVEELKDRLIDKGYTIIFATDGKTALDHFAQFRPQLVIISDDLPIYDGIELTEKIRDLIDNQSFIPFILLSVSEKQFLLHELSAYHIDDYYYAPLDNNKIIYKIDTLIRYQLQMNTISHKYHRLNSKYHRLQYELDTAERCFLKTRPSHHIQYNDIQYQMTPHSLSNGDVLFYEKSPQGDRYIILGDFTGHGLSAAISACSIKGIFEEMVKNSHSLEMIVNEINDELTKILPPELFAAICAVKINCNEKAAEIWNGSLPTVYIYNKYGIKQTLDSQYPPLGIEELSDEELITTKVPITDGDCIMLTTDGLIEAMNKEREMFGNERLLKCIIENTETGKVFQSVTLELNNHLQGMVQPDDVTYLEINC